MHLSIFYNTSDRRYMYSIFSLEYFVDSPILIVACLLITSGDNAVNLLTSCIQNKKKKNINTFQCNNARIKLNSHTKSLYLKYSGTSTLLLRRTMCEILFPFLHHLF